MIRSNSRGDLDSSAVTASAVTAEDSVHTQKQADEILRDHDTSSRYRTDLGWWAWVVGIISILFIVYHLYAALERPFNTWIHSAFHLGGCTALIFLMYSAISEILMWTYLRYRRYL